MRQIYFVATLVLIEGFATSSAADAATAGEAVSAQIAQQTPTTPTRTHSVRGVVERVDATSLVITRGRRESTHVSFALTPSTLREGPILVGSTVSVRYRVEGSTLVATAVVARTPADLK